MSAAMGFSGDELHRRRLVLGTVLVPHRGPGSLSFSLVPSLALFGQNWESQLR